MAVPVLSEAQVEQILTTSHLSHTDMARLLGGVVTRETVRKIRHGVRYRTFCPDLPRWEPQVTAHSRLSCWKCTHHTVKLRPRKDSGAREAIACGLGLPDPEELGANFAQECAVYCPCPLGGHRPH